MMCRNKYQIVFGTIILVFFAKMEVLAQDQLYWQDRGDRFEGVRGHQKNAQLELLSAAVLYKPVTDEKPGEKEGTASIKNTSNKAHLQFYLADDLDDDEHIFITVREFKRHDYWMQPHHQPEWKKGWCNFSWPMADVLKELKPEPLLHELAAVARVEGEYSHKLSPIVLYQTEPPTRIATYRFIFRPPDNGDILDLTCTWHRLDVNPPEQVSMWKPLKERQRAGQPIYIDWKCIRDGASLPEGWYQMSLEGLLEYPSRDEELDEIYLIYHQPVVEVKK